MATLDIRGTVVGETATAIKAPCLAATTGANIALTGIQAIDGVTVGTASERVLVKDQTAPSQNGIYIASTGPWVPAADWAGNAVVDGTLVLVVSGAVNGGVLFTQTCPDDPVIIGTSLIAFVPLAAATAQAATSATSLTIATGVQTLAVAAGKAFAAGQWVLIQETSDSANQMLGQITAYAGTSLAVDVVATGGAGTFADWTVVLTNSAAAAGWQPPIGSGNVTGPGAATAGHVATFAGPTGKVIQDGGALGSLAALSALSAQYLAPSAAAFGINMLNGQVVATVAAGALTFAIVTLAGATPSAADPVWFMFRSATPSSGALSVVPVTSALAVTVPAGSTMGFSNATPGRLWLSAVNAAGTVSLVVINCLSGGSIFPLAGWGIVNVTAFGTGANNAQVFYGAASLAGVPYGVLGYATYEAGATLPTAGTWSTPPTRLEMYRPGVPLPGQEIQRERTLTGAAATGTVTFTVGSAIPTNTQGNQYMSQTIIPTSSANLLEIEAQGWFTNSGGGAFCSGLFQDAGINAVAVTWQPSQAASAGISTRAVVSQLAATLSATTFKYNSGASNSGTTFFNSNAGGVIGGGVLNSFIQVREFMA